MRPPGGQRHHEQAGIVSCCHCLLWVRCTKTSAPANPNEEWQGSGDAAGRGKDVYNPVGCYLCLEPLIVSCPDLLCLPPHFEWREPPHRVEHVPTDFLLLYIANNKRIIASTCAIQLQVNRRSPWFLIGGETLRSRHERQDKV